MLIIYVFFHNYADACNAQVALLLIFTEWNQEWKKLKYKWYNECLEVLDRSGIVKEIVEQHHSDPKCRTIASKSVEALWQWYPELKTILGSSLGSEMWLWITSILSGTTRDSQLTKWFLNCTYVNHLTKRNWNSKANRWYTSTDIQEV